MNIPSPRSKKKARIEIIPLIDVMFFLLATFVMVSLSMMQNKGIPVNLPTSSTSLPQELHDPAFISVTEKGDIYFDKEQVSADGLREKLQQLKATSHDPKVFLDGDEKAFLGGFISIIDAIRQSGITKIAIQTQSTQPIAK